MADNSASEGRVRRYLQDRGGSVEDALGRGLTDQMARELGDKPAALSVVLAQMESKGVITRDKRGLRTYRIALVEQEEASAGSEAVAGASGASQVAPRVVPASGNGSDVTPEPRSMRTVRLRDAVSRPPAPAETAVPGAVAAAPGGGEAGGAPPAHAGAAAVGAAAVGAAAVGAAAEAPTEPPNGGTSNRTLSLREAIARQSGSSGPAAASPTPATAPPSPTTAPPSPTTAPPSPTTAAGASAAPPTTAAGASAPPPTTAAGASAPPPPPLPPFGPPAGDAPSAAPPESPAASADDSPSSALRARLGITDADAGAAAAGGVTTTGFPPRRPGRSYSSPRSFSGTATSTVPTTPTAPVQTSPTQSYGTITPTAAPTAKGDEVGRAPRRSRLTVVPTVKREPTRTLIWGIVAAFLGIVIIAGGYYAFYHNSKAPIANQPQPATDACNIVTSSMASTLFGDDAGRPSFVLGECVYQDASATHELLIEDYHSHEPQVYASTHTAAAQDIPNLGTAAYYVGGSLWVVDGTNIMELTLANPTSSAPPPSTPPAALVNLARQALPGLVNPPPGS